MTKSKTTEYSEWFTRFEKRFGANETASSLQKLADARDLFYEELGYNVTRRQFEVLRGVNNEREQYLIEQNIRVETGRKYTIKNKGETYQTNYRNVLTGKFTKSPFTMDKVSVEKLALPTAPPLARQSRRGYENRKG